MAKRLRLKLEHNIDFNLYGVVTSLRDFEIAFYLNKSLSFCFKKHQNEIWYQQKSLNKNITHTIFQYQNEEGFWNIIQNKGKLKQDYYERDTKENSFFLEAKNTIRKSLLEQYRQVDYFLQTPDTINRCVEKQIQKSIKKMPNITTVFKLDTNKIKEIERLFFE